MSSTKAMDATKFKPLANAAAGHDGVLSDESGEVIIKPCTDAEITFYQETLANHPDFAELMPTFMGTLSLGAPEVPATEEVLTQEQKDQQLLHGKKLATGTAIVIENLEHGFKHANVLDLKLGAKLYDPDTTAAEKAARLNKNSAETTSSSLNFRIAGMKVWDPDTQSFEVYDKFYGRNFTADDISKGFETFFKLVLSGTEGLRGEAAGLFLETILAEVTKARHLLEKAESRMYGASILIVFEGDPDAMRALWSPEDDVAPQVDERAPTKGEVRKSLEEEEDEEDEEGVRPAAFKVKMIDFAHAAWKTGAGPDENVIKGLKNAEEQLDRLVAQFDWMR